MTINILVDNKKSWIMPYARQLVGELKKKHQVFLAHNQNDLRAGDFAFFLGCEKIVIKNNLRKNKYNLVVHESDLPQGKGFSPLTWQILEGKNEITITLFEAAEKIDSGDIYLQEVVHFEGHELVDELRRRQGEKTIEMIKRFLSPGASIVGKKQKGRESFYRRRTLEDSELDLNKTLKGQFNLLRIVDNERYPAFFYYLGHRYVVRISKDG